MTIFKFGEKKPLNLSQSAGLVFYIFVIFLFFLFSINVGSCLISAAHVPFHEKSKVGKAQTKLRFFVVI